MTAASVSTPSIDDPPTHMLSIFAGRKGLGNSETFLTTLPGEEVERCHAHACRVMGVRWGDLCDCSYDLTAEQATPFLAVPELAELLTEQTWRDAKKPRYGFEDMSFQQFYLETAKHGARLLGLDLRYSPDEAYQIDAGGEIYGACQ